MKLKSILATAVLCAITAQSVSPASFAAETGSAEAAPASALTVLADANGGTLPQISYAENKTAAVIDGAISDKRVKNERDAAAVLKSIAGLLGVRDFDSELVFDDKSESAFNDTYSFRQVYEGLRVSGSYVKLVVNKSSGKADYLTSSFAADLALDTSPAITADAAKAMMLEKLNTAVCADPELTVCRTDDGAYCLAWHAVTDSMDASIVYLDAEDGSVLRQVGVSNALPASTEQMYSVSNGAVNPVAHANRFLLTYSQQNGKFYSYDSKRNIYVTNYSYNPESAMIQYYQYNNRKKQYYYGNSLSGLTSYASITNNLGLNALINNTYSDTNKRNFAEDSACQVGTMYVLQRIYDFYLNNFGWKGTDGNGSALAVNGMFSTNKGSFACPAGNFIAYAYYGKNHADYKESAAAAWDVAAHEYTHRVTIAKVKWEESSYYSEANALSEAYSDIIGEYFENKLQWKFGEDQYKGNSGRYSRNSACSPASGKEKNPWDGNYYYYNYKTYQNEKTYLEHFNQYIDPHNASTILSHAACLIHKSALPTSYAREIWFASLDYLPQGTNAATFSKCRTAVLRATDAVLAKKSLSASVKTKYKQCVIDAFNAVGIQ